MDQVTDTALEVLINKIKADNYSECLSTASSFYDMAFRRGYEAGFKDGKKEGRVRIKEVPVKDVDYCYNGGL